MNKAAVEYSSMLWNGNIQSQVGRNSSDASENIRLLAWIVGRLNCWLTFTLVHDTLMKPNITWWPNFASTIHYSRMKLFTLSNLTLENELIIIN